MQMFPCPFCGPRDETEFFYAGESGKLRPQPADEVADEAWSEYLHLQANPCGETREIWRHVCCGEFFILERNSATHEVLAVQALPHWDQP